MRRLFPRWRDEPQRNVEEFARRVERRHQPWTRWRRFRWRLWQWRHGKDETADLNRQVERLLRRVREGRR